MTFLVQPLSAWSSNLGKRLVKAPKLSMVDTGLACHLVGLDEGLRQVAKLPGEFLKTLLFSNYSSMPPGPIIPWDFTTSDHRQAGGGCRH